MNFKPSEDHAALMDAVHTLVAREAAARPAKPVRFEYFASLHQAVEDAGFFGCIAIEELGAVAATDVVMALSRLPFCMELVGSCLIAPLVCSDMPGPYALVAETLDQPIRFAPVARTLICLRTHDVQVAALPEGAVDVVASIFAYPMGRLRDPAALVWRSVQEAQPGMLNKLWRVGLAAEIAGSLSAALDSVLRHVKDRRQFGRPLGSFQAVQHRLAQCASWIESARWLALKAAGTGLAADAAMAAGFAQHIATPVAYDLHQFMGAMGLTLEHPLHRWTYRSKLLRSELAGAAGHFAELADAAWPQADDATGTAAHAPSRHTAEVLS